MASHHHHQQQNRHQHHSTVTCCCFSTPPSSCPCWSSNPICPPPPVAASVATDPLLHTIALHLLQSTPPLTQPQHFFSQTPLYQHQYHKTQEEEEDPRQQTHLINSLLQRIAALEASSLKSPPSRRPVNLNMDVSPQRSTLPKEAGRKAAAKGPVRVSLRDIAARTIQTQFRLYLVRRSQTLRHLKQLSIIRSHLDDLGSLNPRSVSDLVMDLLLRVDSIQSRDPMIREGKRSLGNELLRILEMAKMESLQQEQQKRLQTCSSEPSSSVDVDDHDEEEEEEDAEVEEVVVVGEEAEGKMMNNGAEVTAGFRYGLDSSSSSSTTSSSPPSKGGRYVKNGNPYLGLFAPSPLKMEYHRKAELS